MTPLSPEEQALQALRAANPFPYSSLRDDMSLTNPSWARYFDALNLWQANQEAQGNQVRWRFGGWGNPSLASPVPQDVETGPQLETGPAQQPLPVKGGPASHAPTPSTTTILGSGAPQAPSLGGRTGFFDMTPEDQAALAARRTHWNTPAVLAGLRAAQAQRQAPPVTQPYEPPPGWTLLSPRSR